MSHICKACGVSTEYYVNGMCGACYRYFRLGGTQNPIPPPGTIAYDIRGMVICHICGRDYKRLGSHSRESHDMTIEAYKEMFGLCRSAKTTEELYHLRMRTHAIENNMPKGLEEVGRNTRIQPGDNSYRKDKPVRLQEILDKRNRGNPV